MSVRSLIGAVSALAMCAACTTVPDLDVRQPAVPPTGSDYPPTVADIVNKIGCDLQTLANQPQYSQLKSGNYKAVVNLTLRVDTNAGLTPNMSFIHPLHAAMTSVTYTVGGELSETRQRTFTEAIQYDISTLTDVCKPYGGKRYDLLGDIGIQEIVSLGLQSFSRGHGISGVLEHADANCGKPAPKPAKGKASQKPADCPPIQPVFGSSVQFVLKKALGGVGVAWKLQKLQGPGGLFGAGRSDTHTMIIAFAPAGSDQNKVLINTMLLGNIPGQR